MALAQGQLADARTGSVAGRLASLIAVLVALGLIAAAMFLPVIQSSDATTTGYAISRNQQELDDLQAQIHSSEAAIADLGSMDRIQSEAARLGMTPAGGKSVDITVNAAPSEQILLPRRYVPPAEAGPPAVAPRGLLQSLLGALSRR